MNEGVSSEIAEALMREIERFPCLVVSTEHVELGRHVAAEALMFREDGRDRGPLYLHISNLVGDRALLFNKTGYEILRMTQGSIVRIPSEQAKNTRDFSKPLYFTDPLGAIWRGPTNPDNTLHYARYEGIYHAALGHGEELKGKPIWTLTRSEIDPLWIVLSEVPDGPQMPCQSTQFDLKRSTDSETTASMLAKVEKRLRCRTAYNGTDHFLYSLFLKIIKKMHEESQQTFRLLGAKE